MGDLGALSIAVQAHEPKESLVTYVVVIDAGGTAWNNAQVHITSDMFAEAYLRSCRVFTSAATTAHAINGNGETGALTVQRGNQQLVSRVPMDAPGIMLITENAVDPPKHWIGRWSWPCPYLIYPGDMIPFYLPPADDGGPTGDYNFELVFQIMEY